jgi:hypothetical protein
MIRNLLRSAALAALVGTVACEDALVVDNPVSGNTDKVLGTPADAENLIGSYYKNWYSGVYGSIANMEGRLNVWSLTNFSSLANECQNSSYPFGSSFIENTPGTTCGGNLYRLYRVMGEVNRVGSSFIRKLDGEEGDPLNLGSPARNNRGRAFAEMLRGLSLGYLAIMYDSAAIISAQMTADDAGVLAPHTEVFDSSMAAFARAIAITSDPVSGSASDGGFPLPPEWIPSPLAMDVDGFLRFLKSHRARIRANVARTPAERAAVDWPAVILDAQQGFQADFKVKTSPTRADAVTTAGWKSQYNAFATWHQMPPFYIGMADVSGSYAGWIAQPLGDRGAGSVSFTMVTPDLRFPQGATRTAQQTDFALSTCQTPATVCKRYFLNRPSADDQFSGAGWGFSNYNFVRFRSWHIAGDAGVAREGAVVLMPLAELDLLQAEGLYRANDFAGAAALINKTRTRGMLCQDMKVPGTTGACAVGSAGIAAFGGGLPAITAFDATSPVPGGVDCVPKVPQAPGYNTVACGNMWEALKYEKRIETMFTHYLANYLDSRGWGDLPKGAPLFLPVPHQDWLARGKANSAIYHTGEGPPPTYAPNSAQPTVGTYGW